MSSSLLTDILDDAATLSPERRERGMAHGRRTSSPVSRRAPVDLDALVLTDPRTGVLAMLIHWAGRIRRERPPAVVTALRTAVSEARVIYDNWDWAMRQPWGGQMHAELQAMSRRLHEWRYGVSVRPCPVCHEPARLDRFIVEHRQCISVPLIEE